MNTYILVCFAATIVTCQGQLNNLVRNADNTLLLEEQHQGDLDSINNNNNRRFGYAPGYGPPGVSAGIHADINIGPSYPPAPVVYAPAYPYPAPYPYVIG